MTSRRAPTPGGASATEAHGHPSGATVGGCMLRLPDQFTPARNGARAGTPTCGCCCCCCCCVATMITTSIVVPMRIETAARADGAAVRGELVWAKVLAAFAPWLALVVAVAAMRATNDVLAFAVVLAGVLGGLLAVALARVGRAGNAVPITAVFGAAFAVEFGVGLVGILFTFGIGYLLVAGAAAVAVVLAHRR